MAWASLRNAAYLTVVIGVGVMADSSSSPPLTSSSLPAMTSSSFMTSMTTVTSTVSSSFTPTFTTTYTWKSLKGNHSAPTLPPTKNIRPITVTSSSSNYVCTQYAMPNGSYVPYFSSTGSDGNQIMFDVSNNSRIAAHVTAAGLSMVMDKSGFYIYNKSMSGHGYLPVDLTSVLNQSAPSNGSQSKRSLYERTAQTAKPVPVNFAVDYFDQCGKPLAGHAASAICDMTYLFTGAVDQQTMSLKCDIAGECDGSCQSVSQHYTENFQMCLDKLSYVLDFQFPGGGLLGSVTNWQLNLVTILALFRGYALASSALAFAGPAYIAIMAALAAYGTFQQLGGTKWLEDYLCHAILDYSMAVYSGLDIENGALVQVNSQPTPPFTTFTASRTVSVSTRSCSSSSSKTKPPKPGATNQWRVAWFNSSSGCTPSPGQHGVRAIQIPDRTCHSLPTDWAVPYQFGLLTTPINGNTYTNFLVAVYKDGNCQVYDSSYEQGGPEYDDCNIIGGFGPASSIEISGINSGG